MPRSSMFALALSAATLALLLYLFQKPDPAIEPVVTPPDDYHPRDWDAGKFSRLNISLFTFSDNNRNGHYDTGDRPLGAIAVRVTRPDGSVISERSNINGYANFVMLSDGADKVDISQAYADYHFAVSVPPGWQVTTGNGEQVAHFTHLPGSPSGLIAENPPTVVGLMPHLRISGRVEGPRNGEASVSAITPAGEHLGIELDKTGTFDIEAQPGAWLLTIRDDATGALRRRDVQVGHAPVQLSAIDLSQPVPEPLAFPVVEDFEYARRSVLDKLPGGQSGLGWDFMIAVDNQYYGGDGYSNGLRSGKMVGYNSSGHPVTITPVIGQDSFDFIGAYFSVAWISAQGETLLVRAWRDGKLVGREEITLSCLGPVWFQADYHRIDRLELASAHYWQFVTDDMAFRLTGDPHTQDPGQAPSSDGAEHQAGFSP